jgi:predicted amidohydrolase YtcJ
MRTALVLVLIMTASVLAQNAPEKPKADIIFTHGNVYTGTVDPTSMVAGKRAEAIAIRGDRILVVGTRDEILKIKARTPDHRLGGRFVIQL